jgi:hypothetical protein
MKEWVNHGHGGSEYNMIGHLVDVDMADEVITTGYCIYNSDIEQFLWCAGGVAYKWVDEPSNVFIGVESVRGGIKDKHSIFGNACEYILASLRNRDMSVEWSIHSFIHNTCLVYIEINRSVDVKSLSMEDDSEAFPLKGVMVDHMDSYPLVQFLRDNNISFTYFGKEIV